MTPDQEMTFLQASPDLDNVETALRAGGHNKLADALFKLQQDIGLSFSGTTPSDVSDDMPQTAALVQQYEGRIDDRAVYILRECRDKVATPDLKQWLASFMDELALTAQPAPAKSSPKSPAP